MPQYKNPEAEVALLAGLDASTDEDQPADAVAAFHAAGVKPQMHDLSLLVSVPLSAEIRLRQPRAGTPARCIGAMPAAFSRSTGDETVEGALVIRAADDERTVSGAIVLTLAGPSPDVAYANERHGALAQIFVSPEPAARRQSITTITGTPTHESIARRPRTPVVCVTPERGEELGSLAARGEAIVSIATRLREGFEPAVLPVAEIAGTTDPEEFILVHGREATPLARLTAALHTGRQHLKRSIRVAVWPCAAFSANAAATWYADTFADDIDRHCVAHAIVPDRAAAAGAQHGVSWMAEAADLCLDAIADAGAERVPGRRPARPDSPFNQVGVTGLFGGRRFERDLHATLLAVCRVANAPLHPFDYTASVLEIGAAIQRYQSAAERELDLSGVSKDLGDLRRAINAWRASAEAALAAHPEDTARRRRLNARLRRLARVLVPLGYARGERFDHDPAIQYSAVPRLEAALHVSQASVAMKPFILTALLRERNKVRAAVSDAFRCIT